MNNYLKSLFIPRVDTIMSSFNSTINLLEKAADVQADLAAEHRVETAIAQLESYRAAKLALKLKAAFTI